MRQNDFHCGIEYSPQSITKLCWFVYAKIKQQSLRICDCHRPQLLVSIKVRLHRRQCKECVVVTMPDELEVSISQSPAENFELNQPLQGTPQESCQSFRRPLISHTCKVVLWWRCQRKRKSKPLDIELNAVVFSPFLIILSYMINGNLKSRPQSRNALQKWRSWTLITLRARKM